MNAQQTPAPITLAEAAIYENCGKACKHCDNPATCPLNKLGIGCHGFVVAVGGDGAVRRRLLEMGFCNGAHVEVIRRAPFGDPIEFRLRGYHLSLRDEQARLVQILPN